MSGGHEGGFFAMLWWILLILAALVLLGILCQALYAKRTRTMYKAPGVLVQADQDTKMHVYALGGGRPAVILSGWGCGAPCVDYLPLMKELVSRGFRAIVVEKPGYGFSDRTDKPRDIDTVVAEIRGALLAAGEKGPYILLGHSLAGTEILRFATLYKQDVSGLVSIDAPAPLCYTTLPLPKPAMLLSQAFMRFSGLWLLMTVTNSVQKFYDKNVNGYRLLTKEELTELNRMNDLNAANPCVRRELTALGKNCVKAGDAVPEGIKLVMLIASDTRERLYDKLKPLEDEYIEKNRAAVYDVEGKHNLQQYAPARIAEITAKEFIPS